MKIGFLAKRFAQVLAIAFVTVTSVYMVRGQVAIEAAKEASLWSLISATIFAGTVVYYQRAKKTASYASMTQVSLRYLRQPPCRRSSPR